jgi:hypothetical protein
MKNISIIAVFALLLLSCNGQNQKKDSSKKNQAKKEQQVTSTIDTATIIQRGDSISMVTGKTLMGQLQAAMGRGGIEEAVKYCNVNAYPLTDSISNKFNVSISRAAERNRNPENSLQEQDVPVFEQYKNNEDLGSLVKTHGDDIYFYKPINLKGFCVSCHGNIENNIGEENYALIKKLYPNDKAINFSPGDLRGMWKIKFEENGKL